MSFIDLSDPEEMLSLLIEYVEDERNEAYGDSRRNGFLSWLVAALVELEPRFSALSGSQRVQSLERIRAAIDIDFNRDPVVEHLSALIEELGRISE